MAKLQDSHFVEKGRVLKIAFCFLRKIVNSLNFKMYNIRETLSIGQIVIRLNSRSSGRVQPRIDHLYEWVPAKYILVQA